MNAPVPPNSSDRVLSSSLRSRTAEESLAIVETIAASRGITRVVDTTWLDRIGIPVYAAVRPNANRKSLAVHAGKGFTHAEAKIGAYMEALEFSFAGYGHSDVEYQMVEPQHILDSFNGKLRFVDFCPLTDRKLAPGDRIAAVKGDELLSGLGSVLIPADLAYHMFEENPVPSLYGTSTNGLASGNTLMEATVHAMAEVMERHVNSFHFLDDQTLLVDLTHTSEKIRNMVKRIEAAGLGCALRYCPNEFGLPHFMGFVFENEAEAPVPMAGGHGFHPNREIAAVRALAEAVQSRLSFIHGGRDDLIKRYQWAEKVGREAELNQIRILREACTNAERSIAFYDTPSAEVTTVKDAQDSMFAALKRVGMEHVVRVRFTHDDYPFQVVKVVIPGCEFFDRKVRRVGPRLMAMAQSLNSRRSHA